MEIEETFVKMSKMAVAVAIIRAKPLGLTGRQFAEMLAKQQALRDEGWKTQAQTLQAELMEAKQRHALAALQLRRIGLTDDMPTYHSLRPPESQRLRSAAAAAASPCLSAACTNMMCRATKRNYDFLSKLVALQAAHCTLELHKAGRPEGGEISRVICSTVADTLDLLLEVAAGSRASERLLTVSDMTGHPSQPTSLVACDRATGSRTVRTEYSVHPRCSWGLTSAKDLLDCLLLVLDSEGFGVLVRDSDLTSRLKVLCKALLHKVLRGDTASEMCQEWLTALGRSRACWPNVMQETLDVIEWVSSQLHNNVYEGTPLDVDAFENAEKVVSFVEQLRLMRQRATTGAEPRLSDTARGYLRQLTLYYPVFVLEVERVTGAAVSVSLASTGGSEVVPADRAMPRLQAVASWDHQAPQ